MMIATVENARQDVSEELSSVSPFGVETVVLLVMHIALGRCLEKRLRTNHSNLQ